MYVNAMCTYWAPLSGYDMSALHGAMGYGALGTYGVAAAQRVPVAYLTGCVRVRYQHCAGWRASRMLVCPCGNFLWSDCASTTLCWVDSTWHTI